MMLPAGCVALIVQDQWFESLALECALEEIGCATLGPVADRDDVERLIGEQRPSFALLDWRLGQRCLVPVARRLTGQGVPFALLTLGATEVSGDRAAPLHEAPHLARYLHPPSLYAVAQSLIRVDLRARLGETDRRIDEGQLRLARQLRLIESLEVAGADIGRASALAREIARALRTMRASRTILAQQLTAEEG